MLVARSEEEAGSFPLRGPATALAPFRTQTATAPPRPLGGIGSSAERRSDRVRPFASPREVSWPPWLLPKFAEAGCAPGQDRDEKRGSARRRAVQPARRRGKGRAGGVRSYRPLPWCGGWVELLRDRQDHADKGDDRFRFAPSRLRCVEGCSRSASRLPLYGISQDKGIP